MQHADELKALARRVPEEIATDGEFDLIEEVYAADAVEHGPTGDVGGRGAIRESFDRFAEAFGDFSATVDDVVAEGDTVAMRLTWRGTHEGEFQGIEATGESFEVANTAFTRIEDGKIAERWVQPDTLGLLAQLGALADADESVHGLWELPA